MTIIQAVSLVQSLSRVWLFATPWTALCQASLSITNSRSPPKLMSVESVMPSNHLILSFPAFNLSQHQGLFQWVSCSYQMAKILKWLAIPFSSGAHSVRPLHHDLPILGCPAGMVWFHWVRQGCEEIPHAQGKRNPVKMVAVAREH